MATRGLFITMARLKKDTAIAGTYDADKIIQWIWIAQETHIQNYLGTDLYDKINDDILASTLTGVYLTLNTDYIQPMLVHWALVEYLPFAAYTIANKGVFKHTSENAESVQKNEVDFLVEKQRNIAEHYTQRFIDYICNNSSDFPEYTSNSEGDMYPDKTNFFEGWMLD